MNGILLHCFYHKACADGITAAAVVHGDVKAFPSIQKSMFTSIGYGPPSKISKSICRVVQKMPTRIMRYWAVFVDYTPHLSVVRDLASIVSNQGVPPEKLIILDHHQEIPEDQIKKYRLDSGWKDVKIIINKEMSGASLAWRYTPSLLLGQDERDHKHPDTPPLVRYVEDRDLWRFKYGDLSKIIGYGTSHEITMAGGRPDIASWSWSINDVTKYLIIGAAIYDAFVTKTDKARTISLWSVFDERLFSNVKIVDPETKDETWVLLINSKKPGDPFMDPGILSSVSLISEVCSFFLDLPLEDREKNGWRYSVVGMLNGKGASFRSRNGDALKVATILGGGGHADAAGCPSIKYNNLIEASIGCQEVL